MAGLLENLQVERIDAVEEPATKRRWIVLKAADLNRQRQLDDHLLRKRNAGLREQVEKRFPKTAPSREVKKGEGVFTNIVFDQGDGTGRAVKKSDKRRPVKKGDGLFTDVVFAPPAQTAR
jgi:hypothetical protein